MDVKLNPQSAKLLADIRGYLALNEQQRKVIEAAKAFIAESPNTMVVPWHDLRRAVEALLAAEGGEE